MPAPNAVTMLTERRDENSFKYKGAKWLERGENSVTTVETPKMWRPGYKLGAHPPHRVALVTRHR